MNFTKRYFTLKEAVAKAIGESALPALAVQHALGEISAQLAGIIESELQAEETDEKKDGKKKGE